MKKFDIIIIGGGASGLMAANAACSSGKKILLLEQNEKLGKKLYITGKGRCNITSSLPIDYFFKYISRNSKFLISSFNKFSNLDVIEFFNSRKVTTKEER